MQPAPSPGSAGICPGSVSRATLVAVDTLPATRRPVRLIDCGKATDGKQGIEQRTADLDIVALGRAPRRH
jgi:hypothetical protein